MRFSCVSDYPNRYNVFQNVSNVFKRLKLYQMNSGIYFAKLSLSLRPFLCLCVWSAQKERKRERALHPLFSLENSSNQLRNWRKELRWLIIPPWLPSNSSIGTHFLSSFLKSEFYLHFLGFFIKPEICV